MKVACPVVTAGLLLSVLAASSLQARDLSFDERVRAQAAIERVAYSHQVGEKLPFAAAVPRSVLEARVRTYLAQSAALDTLWGTPVTAEMLRGELERMARGTRMPERLLEYYEALERDPFLVEECLVRPALVDRLTRSRFAAAPTNHAADVVGRAAPKKTWDEWWSEVAPTLAIDSVHAVSSSAFSVPRPDGSRPSFDPARFQASLPCAADDTWDEGALSPVPPEASFQIAVWTGSAMLVWGKMKNADRAFGVRYDPATDTWQRFSTIGAPPGPYEVPSVVWTGTHMIVWGGATAAGFPDQGGRYDPLVDTWSPTSTVGAPLARKLHTAVWTGEVMLVWGGLEFQPYEYTNTGGRYDPDTDTWAPTTTVNAPLARGLHTAVWSGDRMVVWGGENTNRADVATGARYDPVADAWTATSTTAAPIPRSSHTAVWTGSRMVVWGGERADSYLDTGGVYDPVADAWTATSTIGAATRRFHHTAVWTGIRMIVWGGHNVQDIVGGVYDPVTDSWTATSALAAPMARSGHSALWAGSRMIVWGGSTAGLGSASFHATGGLYDPAADDWKPTATADTPERRDGHAAVWTGNVMIVWGGHGLAEDLQDGGRYDPALDAWSPVTQVGAPSSRHGHTGLWTGSRMLVWGGANESTGLDTGGLYDPIADAWKSTSTVLAPQKRNGHTAVWTGDRMIVWGGRDGPSWLESGGIYDPAADVWSAVSGAGAPSAREGHVAVWTGDRMIVWGGFDNVELLRTGGRYDPASDTWLATPTSGSPTARSQATAIWAAGRVIVWGGFVAVDAGLRTGSRYDPTANAWSAITTLNAPSARYGHSALWTGDRMMVWGGRQGTPTSTGALYDPVMNAWTVTSALDAPAARSGHTAVWAGSLALIWGGFEGAEPVEGGGRYARGLSVDGDGDGFSECAGDCNDDNASTYPGASDLCDGLDNDCNGTADEGFDTPDAISGLVFLDHESLSWNSDPVADRYDTARGDLGALRAADGDFGAALMSCVADDAFATTAHDASSPMSGPGFFYLVRGQDGCKKGSYDTGAASEVADRDPTLVACP